MKEREKEKERKKEEEKLCVIEFSFFHVGESRAKKGVTMIGEALNLIVRRMKCKTIDEEERKEIKRKEWKNKDLRLISIATR